MAAAPSPTEAFFGELARRGQEPLVRSADGTIRWDVTNGHRTETWFVRMRGGEIEVSHKRTRADAVVRVDKRILDGMVSGTVNTMAAFLRGELTPEGDLGLLMLFQRLFPAPPRGGRAHA